jgi:outer membrane biosynthesis protein TonB
MKRLIPILLLSLIALAGCKSNQWTFSKSWGGGESQPTSEPAKPEPAIPEPAKPAIPTEPTKPVVEVKPEQVEAPKDVIFVLGINGMD